VIVKRGGEREREKVIEKGMKGRPTKRKSNFLDQ
jgi:hypothetical protein